MSVFFQVLGIVCFTAVLLVGLLFGALLLFRKKLKNALEGLSDLKYMETPNRLHLRPETELEWKDAAAVAGHVEALTAAGFQSIGLFGTEELDYLRIHALCHEEQRTYAVVYEHDKAGVWVDLVTRYEDGTSLTYATTGEGAGLDQRPGHGITRVAGAEPVALYQRMLNERPQRPMKPVSAADFRPSFEAAFAEEMDWRNSRGGPTEEEVRALAEADGEEITDEVLELTRQRMAAQAAAGLTEAIQERFLATTTLTVSEWERVRDSLVIVHDRLLPEQVVSCYFQELVDDDDEDDDQTESEYERREAEARAGTPREVFARWNEALPESQRYRLLGSVAEPVPGDVYVGARA
jgi:hypothetical protein